VPIAVISGSAGVGKTALALNWAHHAAHRFEGCLYVDLQGYGPDAPVDPRHALGTVLRSLGAVGLGGVGLGVLGLVGLGRRRCGWPSWQRGTAASWPAGGCWSSWTTPDPPNRSARCCPAVPPACW
jgi:hypothetical protein